MRREEEKESLGVGYLELAVSGKRRGGRRIVFFCVWLCECGYRELGGGFLFRFLFFCAISGWPACAP